MDLNLPSSFSSEVVLARPSVRPSGAVAHVVGWRRAATGNCFVKKEKKKKT
jgi:hypothetical protein